MTAPAPTHTRDHAGSRRGRILFATSNFPRWAGDSTTPFVLHLAQDLAALGWDIDVLAPHAPGAAREEAFGAVGVHRFRYWWREGGQTVCYGGGALVRLRSSRANLLKLPALVAAETAALAWRAGNYDLVHAHWLLPQGFAAAAVEPLSRTPFIATVHGGDAFALNHPVLRAFKRLVLARARAVTVNSSATEAAIARLMSEGRAPLRIPMGANGPDRSRDAEARDLRARVLGRAPFAAIFVGRLVPEKGADDLIRALALAGDALAGAALLIVGDGPQRSELERLAQELGVASRVHFAGWIDAADIPIWLRAADVFVGPSRPARNGWVEAQGITFAEALLAERPVIATRSGGIADLVQDGETGLLVDPGCPDQLARALVRLAGDRDLGRLLAAAGEERARGAYTREASAARFSELYAALLGRP